MRLISFLLSAVLLAPNPQQSATQSASAVQQTATLQQSLAALIGNTPLSDITLTGTAHRMVGSDDETGSVIFQAMSGSSRILLTFPSGTRSETHSVSNSLPSGSRSGPDDVSYSIAQHNLLADAGLFPGFTLASILSNPNSVVTVVGQEIRDGRSVVHLTALRKFLNAQGETAALMQHLSETDIFLDVSTLLPVAIAFTHHPDDDALVDIPVEIHFSDYRPVSGVLIAFHIQKFLNNTLTLEVQLQNAVVNSGLSASTFSAQ